MTPQEENARQRRFAFTLALLAIGVLMIIGLLSVAHYTHAQPAKDCVTASDYPLCLRSTTPPAHPAPTPVAFYLGTLATLIGIILLVWAAYHASVIRQAEIVTSAAGSVPVTPVAAPVTPAAPKPTALQKIPGAIPRNRMLPELVVKKPLAQPAQGVNLKEVR